MKKLKLDHKLAQQVLSGEKWSTWRLFDDKDLSVNDEVELIDKVDPENPESWRPIGVATINKVIEKRLADIEEDDMDGHGKYSSPQDAVIRFQKYYGPDVTINTPVKMIYFDFTPLGSEKSAGQEAPTRSVTEVKIYADGGSRGNPGPSASGFVILDMDDKILVDRGVYLGITTNNQAEYQALKFALEEAQRMRVRKVDVYMDSLLVVNQLKGIFKVRNRDLWPIHDAIKQLAKTFEHISYTQVPRAFNKLADAAVNRALDEELGITKKMS